MEAIPCATSGVFRSLAEGVSVQTSDGCDIGAAIPLKAHWGSWSGWAPAPSVLFPQPYSLSTPRSADRAAYQPHKPWTPPPGGVEDEQMNNRGSGVR